MPSRKTPKTSPQTAEIIKNGHTHEHPSKDLTPQKLHTILEAAERGDIKAQSELFADIEEKDGHIFSEMSKRKRAVIGLDWRIMPPPNSTDAERQLAEEVSGWLDRLTDLEDMMFDLLDAIGHGFACVEIEWQQTGGLWLPKNFIHRPQGWFKVDAADNVLLAKQDNPDGEALWEFGWLVHKHRSRSGLLVRGGLMRTLVWPYLFKNYSVRDLAEFLEIYGLPTRLGKYSVGADEQDKLTLLSAVREIGHNAAGIIPETMNIELLDAASGSSEPFMAMIDWADKTSSKAILGGTLTSMADGKTSTNALGQVHNEVRHDLLVSDAKQLAGTLTQQLILPLLLLNKGNVAETRLPSFQFDTQLPEDMAVYAESLPKLVEMGMKIPLAWAQEKLAIPLASDDEPVLAFQTASEMQGVKAAPLSYRRVALSKHGEIVDMGQAAIDQANLGKIALPEHIEPFLRGLGQALAEGDSYEDVQELLLRAYPHLDSAEFQTALARVVFVADLWGQLNG
nr:DUF935 family protein [Neisseria dumasiana]